MSILDEKATGTVSEMDLLKAEIERLKAQNAALAASKGKGKPEGISVTVTSPDGTVEKTYAVSFKATEKGGVSVYGLGRFPWTGYGPQWLALLAVSDLLKAYINENAEKLSWEKASK